LSIILIAGLPSDPSRDLEVSSCLLSYPQLNTVHLVSLMTGTLRDSLLRFLPLHLGKYQNQWPVLAAVLGLITILVSSLLHPETVWKLWSFLRAADP